MAITSREVESVLRNVFKRCVQCPSGIPTCPTCPSGQQCVQTPPSCDACATAICIANSDDPTTSSNTKSSGPNVGAIAGGVVGGVVFVAIVTFLIWKFLLKGRRRKVEEGDWQEVEMPQEKVDDDFASRRSARASTHTVASMASSVLTRASNIIQIAYIPGVTNRSGPGSPDLLVPPVPPIPAMSPSGTALSSPYSASEQHFFVPDLRDSMATTADGRSSYARTSIAPSLARGSVASTVYRQNAIVSPLPAQTIVRGKAAVVSVKSNGSNSPTDTPGVETPPVPQIDPKHAKQPIRFQIPGMSTSSSLSPQSSIRSTATLGPVRALTITKKKPSFETTPPTSSGTGVSGTTIAASPESTLVPPMRPLTEVSVASTDDGVPHARAQQGFDSDSDSEEEDHARARKSLLRNSSNPRDSEVTDIQETPLSLQSPFSDASSIEPLPSRPDLPQRHTSQSSGLRAPMTPIVEEASKSKRGSQASKRTASPFDDENRTE